jgi:peptide deformylase
MSVRTILRMGDPRLLQPSNAVSEFDTPQLHALIADMMDSMAAERGSGLAAIQIGVPLRVILFGMDNAPRPGAHAPLPRTVLVNPQIQPLSGETDEAWEGCLSVPGMRGLVPRYSHIHYQGLDQYGAPVEREATGYHARVVQHECDHIDGILYPQRIVDMRKFGFVEELYASGAMRAGTLPCEDER